MSRERHETSSLITGIYYERKQHAGPHQHEVIGATALVRAVETPEEALAALREWVGEQLEVRGRVDELIQSCGTLRDEEKTLQEAVSMMRNRYEKARVFLEKIGVPVPTSWHDGSDLPF